MSLGEDLETEILVRLPAKSLMRFKCVQRSWNLLFESPTFASWNNVHTNKRLMVILQHNFNKPSCITHLSSDNPTPTHTPIKSLFRPPDHDNNSTITRVIASYGHCNGVFCLHYLRNELILWNPNTREVHTLPPPLFPFRTNICADHCVVFGFGAADNPNDFRVVNFHVYNSRHLQLQSTAQIYRLSTKSWTLINGPLIPPRNYVRHSKYNTLVNRVYHWLMGKENILCFDFCNNRFSKLAAPVTGDARIRVVWEDITEINGSLAHIVRYHEYPDGNHHRLGIWVMGQQGWAKKYSIGPIGATVGIHGVWKDGAQLLGAKAGEPLTSYDHDGNSVCQFQITVPCNECELWVHEYTPSLATLSTTGNGSQ